MKKKQNKGLCIALKAIGFALCIIPVTACILAYFPAWQARGGEVLFSGITLLLLSVAALPLYNAIKILLTSPASYTVWLIAFIVFLLLSKIADEMVVISFTGFVGNTLGAICFKLAQRGEYEGV